MSTETITRIEDVREDDVATMRSESGTSVTGAVCRVDGGGAISIQLDDVVSQVFAPPTWQFVSATREVTEVEPGTTGTATVRGVEGVRVMRTDGGTVPEVEEEWFSPTGVPAGGQTIGDVWFHPDDQVTDFVPDTPDCGGSCDAAVALRRDVERLRGELDAERDAHRRDLENVGQANVRLSTALTTQDQITDELRARIGRLTDDSVREAHQ